MAKLGFLGLGIMGGPMARHLVTGGHEVAGMGQDAGRLLVLAATVAQQHQGQAAGAGRRRPEHAADVTQCEGTFHDAVRRRLRSEMHRLLPFGIAFSGAPDDTYVIQPVVPKGSAQWIQR